MSLCVYFFLYVCVCICVNDTIFCFALFFYSVICHGDFLSFNKCQIPFNRYITAQCMDISEFSSQIMDIRLFLK